MTAADGIICSSKKYGVLSRSEITLCVKNSEYDQEIQQSQTADRHREEEPHNNHETPGRQTKQSNQLSLQSHRDDCKTRMDIK